MDGRLKDKRAVVTGGSRGIGRGIALALAQAGADVAVTYRREREAAATVVAEIEDLGQRAFAYSVDVRDAPAVAEMMSGARRDLGGLDIAVANAGVATRFQPLHERTPPGGSAAISSHLVS